MTDSLNSLVLNRKVGQLFFIGIAGLELDGATRELLDEVSPGGVCLFARNIRETRQTRKLLDDIREQLSFTPFLSVDQEGGLVDRLRRVMTAMPAPSKLRNSADAARHAAIIGESLALLGFNMDFAPVVDVINNERTKYTNGLFSRTFGHTKEDVTLFADAFLIGLQNNGIVGCLKHFPGLAAARVDSHEELPVVGIPESEMNDIDLFPYRELLASAKIDAIMAAHASFPGHRLQETDQNGKLLPSSLSYGFITRMLREELFFDGLVITDDLEMGAIVKNYGIGDACKMAVMAGADMLSICADPNAVREGFNAVLAAVESGKISIERLDESVARIAAAKKNIHDPIPFDPDRLTQLSSEVGELNSRLNS